MTDINPGDKVAMTVTIDAVMAGLNSGPRARVILPNGEKIWVDLNLDKMYKAILYGKEE